MLGTLKGFVVKVQMLPIWALHCSLAPWPPLAFLLCYVNIDCGMRGVMLVS